MKQSSSGETSSASFMYRESELNTNYWSLHSHHEINARNRPEVYRSGGKKPGDQALYCEQHANSLKNSSGRDLSLANDAVAASKPRRRTCYGSHQSWPA
jgi:hypothetical protein